MEKNFEKQSCTHKAACKILVKLTIGVNFINMFMLSCYACRSKKHKNTVKLSVFIALLGSKGVKALHKMLVKLTPGNDENSF